MRYAILAALGIVVFGSGGCATITSSEMQTLSLTTKQNTGQAVDNAKCSLRNDKGAWEASSPGMVAVHRSAEDLLVECKKEGFATGYLRAVSRAAGGMFGNIIFGGGVGAIIDHTKGTGYDYPDNLPVRLGDTVTVDKRDATAVGQAPCAPGTTSC